MSHEHISTMDVDGVRLVTIDDGKANALPTELTSSLAHTVEAAEHDNDIKALVLAGRAGRFSAGFDLSVMAGGDGAAIREMVDSGGRLARTIYGSTIPVVAACTGHAIAAGALLLLACDVRIGPDADIKIGLNEVAIGMVLPGWAFVLAGERLTARRHAEAVLTGRLYNGQEATEVGYLDYAVPPADVMKTAMTEAKRLAELDSAAYAGSLEIVRAGALGRMDSHLP